MDNTADISHLWESEEYSDLVIKCLGCTWTVHKCIVLPKSKLLRDAANRSDEVDSKGRLVIDVDCFHWGGLDLILRSMYDSVGSENRLSACCRAQTLTAVHELARREGLIELQAQACRAMLRFSKDKTNMRNFKDVVDAMRKMGGPKMLAVADELELVWVPKALVDPKNREKLSAEAVQRYINSVEPRKKGKRSAEDALEHNSPPPAYRTASDSHELEK
ncbi:uncharacterized protein MYCGRDRAFT_96367 [Zymoseptoria tritici IPO323]|uniref:BTB domain-containing protein n=1 Tax=Zymoseptoria tritici (strain CBS 115943 / IPO323) TaxID=336722 RepID=F9XLW5_ZYMTI|nr:uncharacterized protein MYCGRDRAFT_96367 [Zymoseptoria tritici IPO323]EGP84020.1 hypothetical protein MYCGRDRAFT_96367 [Zymoseptoria tritici IPO323]